MPPERCAPLMRRFINSKSQVRLVNDLNREFTRLSRDGRFATAIVATYLSNRNRFTVCNAGHPRPLWYRSNFGLWSYINNDIVETGSAVNLPLGFDDSAAYQQVGLAIANGDILIFYTDALTEARMLTTSCWAKMSCSRSSRACRPPTCVRSVEACWKECTRIRPESLWKTTPPFSCCDFQPRGAGVPACWNGSRAMPNCWG